MKKEVKVPSVGESITTGVVASWFKRDGDAVQQGENLFELETEKAVLEIPSPDAGTLEILVPEGTEVAIGQTVAMLSTDGEAAAPAAPAPREPPAVVEEKPPTPTAPPVPTPGREPEARPAAPVPPPQPVKPQEPPPRAEGPQPARQERPTPRRSGPAQSEAERTPMPQPAPSPAATPPQTPGERRSERIRMSLIRKKTAERLVQAKQTAAYLTTFNEIDMQQVVEIRARYQEQFQKEHGVRIGFMSFFVKACCQALKEFPVVNTQVDDEDIVYHHFYDIGVAMSIESGLIVPILREADRRSFADIEAAIVDLAQRAQEKRLAPDELTGGTFTITNGGVFGSLLSTPIPAYPQTAILGMHAIKKRPVVVGDQVVVRPMMYVALSYDHRAIDGREAIGFLAKIKEFIEDPAKLLLWEL
jgi:2-oxoglutarate dehydrogenase E2 component (dihydrolipoamide succinyltransferase)